MPTRTFRRLFSLTRTRMAASCIPAPARRRRQALAPRPGANSKCR
jgi:hypothetical protein